MSARNAARVAWSLCGLSLALTALSLLLLVLNLSHPNTHIYDYWLDNTLNGVLFPIVGAIVASRRPENAVGWLLCLFGLVFVMRHFSAQYAIYALIVQPDSLPAGEGLAWISSWVWILFIGFFVFFLLLFPTGRLPSRRWRPLAWLTVAVVLVGVISSAFSSGPIDGLGPIRNPLGIEGFRNLYEVIRSLIFPLLFALATLSLFVRLHRAIGVERQQIKWFVYAAAVLASGLIPAYISLLEEIDPPLSFEWVGFALYTAGGAAIPITIGIAILRYRLYDIDRIINRTLVYGMLTGTLALVYFGGVATTQAIFRVLTGQEQQPQLAVVVSTLVIAALFNPLRHRIQAFIDKRFYRRKYDAAKTLEAFSAKLRDETDLDALSDDLVGVVRETMQPAHVSLWLRPDTPRKGEQTG
jgi:hypothetical protein